MKNKFKVGVFGLWHLGCVYATGLAKVGYEVEASDFSSKVMSDLNKGILPVFEPGMEEEIKSPKLKFVDKQEVFVDKKYIFITHDLPVNSKDKVSMKLIDRTVDLMVKSADKTTVFVVSSQVMLGTCRKIAECGYKVLYFPENVRLGKAYETFLRPDRIVLGGNDPVLLDEFEKDFSIFCCPFIKMSWESAEMVKHALNSYLASCVSFSSEVADLCEILGANMIDVVAALKTDKRVSAFAPINPGMGFAGATLGRDVKSLVRLGKKHGYKTKLMNSVYEVNCDRIDWLINKIKNRIIKFEGCKIGILGLTYKPGTSTLRRSMSLELASKLNRLKSKLSAYDPMVKSNIVGYEYISIENNFKELVNNSDVIVLMTEWPEFKEMNLKLLSGKLVFDTKNFFDRKYNFIGSGL